MSGDEGKAQRRFERAGAFGVGMIAIVSPQLAFGFPRGPQGLLFLVLGGLAGGVMALGTARVLPWLADRLVTLHRAVIRRFWPGSTGSGGVGRWLREHRRWWRPALVVGVAAAVALAVVPSGIELVGLRLYGCEHPVQLRVLASPGSQQSLERAADAYERHTAGRNRDCPTANLFVYAGQAEDIRNALRRGWPDDELVRWPRPDVWIADSSVEVDDVVRYEDSLISPADVDRRPLSAPPLLLAVPQPAAEQLRQGLGSEQPNWSLLWELVEERGWDMLRPEPQLPAGAIATAAVYRSRVPDLAEPDAADRAIATELERLFLSSAQRGGYLTDDTDALLCRYRARAGFEPVATVVLTEQEWLAYNAEEIGTGARCGRSSTPLTAFYPEDTLRIDRVFVQLDWPDGDSHQRRAAADFGDWLGSQDGQEVALAGPPSDELVVGATAVGDRPDLATLADAEALRRLSTPNGRMLVLLDTSGSMDRLADDGTGDDDIEATRIQLAAGAVAATLDLMIPDDAYGLWTFPGPDGGAVRERVPVTVASDEAAITGHRRATDLALGEVTVTGATPLFQAIAAGVEELRRSDDDRQAALMVITDGVDSGGGLSAGELQRVLQATDVPQVFVIAVGEAACTDQLTQLTNTSRGRCFPASFGDLGRTLRSVASVIWGGVDD
jgi:hypothetical protein